ncbi:hypothetical protein ACIQAL_17500 [Pseudomonas sp. NPDC088368]|jgi:hypothetical protein|uniref:hypothetical protein n=1 Tax=Pseudomonas sp. NPDC088368 TaxID=3364453 RepID=UPI0037F82FFD
MTGATGAIVGSSVVSFYDGISGQDRDDLFDCVLHADVFASQHFDPKADYSNWLFRYRTRLEMRGWTLINPIKHTPQVIFRPEELDAATIAIIESAGAKELAELTHAAWRSMEINHHADHFFSHSVRDGEMARFQMVPCMTDADGNVLMLICAIRLNGSVDTKDFEFWTETRREMLLRISGGVYRFDRTVYETYREDIRNQLIGSSDRSIKEFPI